jgi:S-adenosylmethionine:tRNA ribosyltransferase-isomerase
MRLSDFDFELPPDRIAQHPADRRDGSRLLRLDRATGVYSDRTFTDLPGMLADAGIGLLVVNDTKVIPARLYGEKPTGGKIEFLLIAPEEDGAAWTTLAKSSKPLKQGADISLRGGYSAKVLEAQGEGRYKIAFRDPEQARKAMESEGFAPLPPYIHREPTMGEASRREDLTRYQTIYAREEGAVAAPTAGLHFTDEVFNDLDELGIERVSITLHVGEGTFLPVRVDDVENHRMHSEKFEISAKTAEAINKAKADGKKIAAVGTTSCRALESSCDESGKVLPFVGSTEIFIRPGFEFRVIDGLITNFHLPKSTLMMLVSAFSTREAILAAYGHAVDSGYRFYSYGDAMVIL